MIIPATNAWSCLPASFSMACGVLFNQFVDLIGHTGSNFPYKGKFRAGFHSQECIEAAYKLGFSCTPIELFPQITPNGIEERTIYFNDEAGNWTRFWFHLNNCKQGVIEGISFKEKKMIGHAVAWNGYLIYDPRGRTYSFTEHSLNNFTPRLLWKLEKHDIHTS